MAKEKKTKKTKVKKSASIPAQSRGRSRRKPVKPTMKASLEKVIADTALRVADMKEKLALRRFRYEEYNQRTRTNLERVKTLHLSVLSIEDPRERASTLREVATIEKEIRDSLFAITEARSLVRRYTKEMEGYERRIVLCKEFLKKSTHE